MERISWLQGKIRLQWHQVLASCPSKTLLCQVNNSGSVFTDRRVLSDSGHSALPLRHNCAYFWTGCRQSVLIYIPGICWRHKESSKHSTDCPSQCLRTIYLRRKQQRNQASKDREVVEKYLQMKSYWVRNLENTHRHSDCKKGTVVLAAQKIGQAEAEQSALSLLCFMCVFIPQ